MTRKLVTRFLSAAFCLVIAFMLLIRSGYGPREARWGMKASTAISTVRFQPDFSDARPAPSKATPKAPSALLAPPDVAPMDCNVNTSRLMEIQQRYQLEDKLQYMKRYVRFHRNDSLQRQSLTELSQPFLVEPLKTIDVKDPPSKDDCAAPLSLDVPASGLPTTVDASDFMFGVSTTYKRFNDAAQVMIDDWKFWLTDGHGNSNGAKLLLMLLDGSDDELLGVSKLLSQAGISADLYHSNSSAEMAVRYLTLVPALYTNPVAHEKKWLVLCDDDTFFPNMHALVKVFARLDHSREMYVGTLSEDVVAVQRHGSQAFGGAGVFLSLPMAKKVTDFYTSCISEEKVREVDTEWGPQGDMLLRTCVYDHSDTRLTVIRDLWQLDIQGDPAGFYEWGIKPLSLHHYRGSAGPMVKLSEMTKLAHVCGEDCTMMRFHTADDFILSGYSVAHYPTGLLHDTNQLEATLWAASGNKGWNLDFVFGPQRPPLEKTGKKITWELQESDVRHDGSVLQIYTRKWADPRWTHPDGQPMSTVDGIIELVWVPF